MTSAFSPVFNIDTVIVGSSIQWIPFNQTQQPQLNFPLTDLIVTGLQVYQQEQLLVTEVFDTGTRIMTGGTRIGVAASKFPFGVMSILGLANQDQVNAVYAFNIPFKADGTVQSFALPPGGYMLWNVMGHVSNTPISLYASVMGQSSLVTAFIAGA